MLRSLESATCHSLAHLSCVNKCERDVGVAVAITVGFEIGRRGFIRFVGTLKNDAYVASLQNGVGRGLSWQLLYRR